MDASLILPIYGAEDFLEKNLQEIDLALKRSEEKWELILVIDASPDRSAEIAQKFAAEPHAYPVQVLINEKNLGKGASVRRGMLAASGKHRIFNDCDLAYPMSEVFKVYESLKVGAMISIASRSCSDSVYIFAPKNFRYLYTRHIASRILNFLIGRLFLPDLKDTQAGLKGFTAASAEFIFSQLRLPGFSFDLEILHLAHQAAIPVQEIPIHFYAQRVSTVNFPVEALRMSLDIWRIYYWTWRGKYTFHSMPTPHEVD